MRHFGYFMFSVGKLERGASFSQRQCGGVVGRGSHLGRRVRDEADPAGFAQLAARSPIPLDERMERREGHPHF
jgi:hypothetical protein